MIAEDLVAEIRPCCARIEIAGSVRRRTPEVGDLDLALIPYGRLLLVNALGGLYHRKPDTLGDTYLCLAQDRGIQVDLYIAAPSTWATLLLIRTGSKQHNIRLAQRARDCGYQLKANGDGLLDLATGEVLPVTSERDLFARRNLPYREPWERDA